MTPKSYKLAIWTENSVSDSSKLKVDAKFVFQEKEKGAQIKEAMNKMQNVMKEKMGFIEKKVVNDLKHRFLYYSFLQLPDSCLSSSLVKSFPCSGLKHRLQSTFTRAFCIVSSLVDQLRTDCDGLTFGFDLYVTFDLKG